MWVRLRSSLPGEATRSSTWKSSVCAQGISSSSPRIASIAQGVRPPLIASEKLPRSATALCPAAGDQLGAAPAPPAFVVGDDLELDRPRLSSASRRGRRTACASPRAPCRRSRRGRARRSARSSAVVSTGAGHALVDRRDRGPAALAGVGDAAGEVREVGRFLQRRRGQVEQPGADHAAAPPDLGDLGDVEVVLVVLGVLERRGLGVGLALRPCRRWRSCRMFRPSA